MGTRALYGFYKDGETKATYNHMDGYPSALGESTAEFARKVPADEMATIFDRIVLVQHGTAEPDQIRKMVQFDPAVDTEEFQYPDGWYGELAKYMGDLFPYRAGLPCMIDSQGFIKDSLFCEWAYIINLDDGVLEVYKGFQEQSDPNRYYDPSVEANDYKNCKLIRSIPFGELRDGLLTELEEELQNA